MSGVIEKVKDKVEQVLHKDSKHQTHQTHAGTQSSGLTNQVGGHNTSTNVGTHHNTGTAPGSTSAEPHNSKLLNKVDPRVDSDRDGSRNMGLASHGPGGHQNTSGLSNTGNTGVGSGSTNYGPHDSNLANKVDPRVDSDRDGSRNIGSATHGPGAHHNTAGGFGNAGVGSGSTNYGPHDSNLANTVDPRVDSDRDGSRNMGAATHGPGAHHNTAGGFGNTSLGSGSTNYGPHDSNLANTVDPRVDSDRDGSRNMGVAAHGPGAHHNTSSLGNTGVGSGSDNYGPHDSNLLNKIDPRVDADGDGSRNMGLASHGPGGHRGGNYGGAAGTTGHTGVTGNTGTTGTDFVQQNPGPAPSTAGPHQSKFANKLDPRIDSDLDGSRTVGSGGQVGGNNTGRY